LNFAESLGTNTRTAAVHRAMLAADAASRAHLAVDGFDAFAAPERQRAFAAPERQRAFAPPECQRPFVVTAATEADGT